MTMKNSARASIKTYLLSFDQQLHPQHDAMAAPSLIKGKSRDMFLFSLLRAQFWARRHVVLLGLATALALTFSSHRLASHQMNTQTLVKAPINDIERDCPAPDYPVLQMSDYDTKKLKICLTTLTDTLKADAWHKLLRWRNFDNLLEMTWPNKQRYAAKHGYHLYDESDALDTSRPPSWSKIRAARRLLTEEHCDWVFWMDADTVIMNSHKRIQDFLPVTKDLVITEQKGGSYNAGAWVIRNSQWSLEFLDTWWNMNSYVQPKGLSTSGDNAALKVLLTGMDKEEFEQHIVAPARCNFNSVTKFLKPKEAESMTEAELKQQFWYKHLEYYHRGDLVAHVAGRS